MRLSDAKKGSALFIEALPAGDIRRQSIRLGICPGAKIRCISTLPGGPVVILAANQEIALGRGLARRIFVGRRPGKERV